MHMNSNLKKNKIEKLVGPKSKICMQMGHFISKATCPTKTKKKNLSFPLPQTILPPMKTLSVYPRAILLRHGLKQLRNILPGSKQKTSIANQALHPAFIPPL